MYSSYSESVLDHADEYGELSVAVIQQLLNEHGLWDTIDDLKMELGDVWNNAETFLIWLGY